MKKEELQQQAELVINPINLVTKMDFKLIRIDSESTLWFNRGGVEMDSDDKNRVSYYYLTKIESHTIGLTYYPTRTKSVYEIWYRKNVKIGLNSKRMEERLDTEYDLCVFLKQSKFKTK